MSTNRSHPYYDSSDNHDSRRGKLSHHHLDNNNDNNNNVSEPYDSRRVRDRDRGGRTYHTDGDRTSASYSYVRPRGVDDEDTERRRPPPPSPPSSRMDREGRPPPPSPPSSRMDREGRRPERDRSRSRPRSPTVTSHVQSSNSFAHHGSSSTNSTKEELLASRRARMARLRAEVDEQDRLDNQQATTSSGTKLPVNISTTGAASADMEELEEDEQMRRLMGFDGFSTTKNSKVDDNHLSSARGAAAKNKARKYRQYMNRKNGFNRPLDKMN